jgi:hypothetical protein
MPYVPFSCHLEPFGSLRIDSVRNLRALTLGRLCENSVHGSAELTTNGSEVLRIKQLAVRPEQLVEGLFT